MIDLLAPSPEPHALRGITLLTISCAARRLRASTSTVNELLACGCLPAVQRGARMLVPEASLRSLQAELLLRGAPADNAA